jgi:hypothetical protein
LQRAFDRNIDFLYFPDSMDESVLISLQHKKRKGRALAVVLSRSVTVRGLSLDTVHARLQETFKSELDEPETGLYERPEEKVLVQLQHYKRNEPQKPMAYVASKSLTVPGVNLQNALRRIKAAFAKPKK